MHRVPLFKPRRSDARMFTSLMMLAAEANSVVALRMMKLMRGGNGARSEAERMVREKIDASLEATTSLVAGASGERIVRRYRKRVAANAKRLSRLSSNRSQKRKDAASIAGKSESTMRGWCDEHGLGRRIGGGTWSVSKVALAMFLDGDMKALRAYHAGDRTGELVAAYFRRAGIAP